MRFGLKASIAIRVSVNLGLLFMLASPASAEWKEKVLYSFQGIPDGAYPAGGVTFDSAGNLYGATTNGGANNCPGIEQCGMVYQLQPPAQKGGEWMEKVLYVFKGVNFNDGNTPEGGALLDQAGNVYGTTAYGGTGKCRLFQERVGCGTVFELIPPRQKGGQWTERVIYSFQGGKDGYLPAGDLTWDNQGNLYGATQYGGGYGSCNAPYYQYCGTVFKLRTPKTKGGQWTEQVLYAFKSGKDGANPNGGLALDSNGGVYGTTFAGGNQDWGTAFQLKPPTVKGGAWTEKILHSFQGSQDGVNPSAGLIFDRRGNLYGTTLTGGNAGGGGTVFRLTPTSDKSGAWRKVILYGFKGTGDGLDLEAPVIIGPQGSLYGTASASGGSYYGTIFRLTLPEQKGGFWSFNLLYGFQAPPDGGQPAAGLVFDSGSNLYGTTMQGGSGTGCAHGCGSVYEVSP